MSRRTLASVVMSLISATCASKSLIFFWNTSSVPRLTMTIRTLPQIERVPALPCAAFNCCGGLTPSSRLFDRTRGCNFFSETELYGRDAKQGGVTHDNRSHPCEVRHRCGCTGGGAGYLLGRCIR